MNIQLTPEQIALILEGQTVTVNVMDQSADESYVTIEGDEEIRKGEHSIWIREVVYDGYGDES